MAKWYQPVGIGPFRRKKSSGLPKHVPEQSGTAVPTDKKSETLGSRMSPGSKHRKYHGQQAK